MAFDELIKDDHKSLYRYCLGCIFLTLVIMIYFDSALSIDGAAWLFQIIDKKKFHFDLQHFRYSNFLSQTPVYLSLNFFPDNIYLAKKLFSVGYFLLPYVGLLFLNNILKKIGQSDFFRYPLLSYVLGFFPTTFYAVSTLGESFVFFWLMIIAYLFLQKWPIKLLIIVLGSLCFVFSHETSIFYSVFLILLNLKEKKYKKLWGKIFLFIHILSISMQVFFVMRVTSGTSESNTFFVSLKNIWPFLGAHLVVFYLVISLKNKEQMRFSRKVTIILTVSSILIFLLYYLKFGPDSHYHLRVMIVPLTILTAIFFLKETVKSLSVIFIAVFTISYSIMNVRIALNWANGVQTLSKEIDKNESCFLIPRQFFQQKLLIKGIADWSIPYLSIHLQEKKTISKIAFTYLATKEQNKTHQINPCRSLYNDAFFSLGDAKVIINIKNDGKRGYNFSGLKTLNNDQEHFVLNDMFYEIHPLVFYENMIAYSNSVQLDFEKDYLLEIQHRSVGFPGKFAHFKVFFNDQLLLDQFSKIEKTKSKVRFKVSSKAVGKFKIEFLNDSYQNEKGVISDLNFEVYSVNLIR